jgi:hypothetical protein
VADRIDRAFRDRAPRIERIDGADQIGVEADQILSGIGSSRTPDPLEHRRYDGSEYEPFSAGAEALDMPLSLHTAHRVRV